MECLFDFDNDGVCDLYKFWDVLIVIILNMMNLQQKKRFLSTLTVVGCLDDSYLEYDTGANVNNLVCV